MCAANMVARAVAAAMAGVAAFARAMRDQAAGLSGFAVSGSGLTTPTTENRIDPCGCHPALVDQTSV